LNLKRYNERLLAFIGTSVVLGAVVLATMALLATRASRPDPGIAVGPATGPMPAQSLSMCSPIVVEGTDFQYLPVAALLDMRTGRAVAMHSEYMMTDLASQTRLQGCVMRSGESIGSIVVNVVVRNVSTNEQRLVLTGPAVITDLQLPRTGCEKGEGGVPCNHALWMIRNTDTNHDGIIDERDAEALYVSSLTGTDLRQVSPSGTAVKGWSWDFRSRELLIQVVPNTGKGAKIDELAGVEVYSAPIDGATPPRRVMDEKLLEQLRKSLR
jgi:hypothetical protein